jgi:hypothetical protein
MSLQAEQQSAGQIIAESYQNTDIGEWDLCKGLVPLLGAAVFVPLRETQFTTLRVMLTNLMWARYGSPVLPLFISINAMIPCLFLPEALSPETLLFDITECTVQAE